MISRSLSTLAAAALICLLAAPSQAQQEWSFEGDRLLLTNLAGEVTIRGHSGSRIVVRATPGGADGERIKFEIKHGGRAEFHAVYPLKESLNYRYSRRGGGSSQIRVENWLDESAFMEELYDEVSRRDRINVGDRGRDALEAWVDLEILVPKGVASRIVLAVGKLTASNVEGDVDIDTHSGPVNADNIRGNARIDTGSGSVEARSIRGNLNVDTGSGRVTVSEVDGELVHIDTGSGSVSVDGARARSLEIDTGSGSVRTARIDAENSLIDTGSGSVTLDLMRLSSGSHAIDTGSGGVTITLPEDASVRILAETGSGGITLEVPNAMLRKMSRDEVELEIGGGDASLQIDTGSGGITIRRR